MTTYHHHIVTYYLHMADVARRGGIVGPFGEAYWLGRAFLYSDFE